MSKNH